MMDSIPLSFPVHLSFQGKSLEIFVTVETTAVDIIEAARRKLIADTSNSITSDTQIKLLYKGKRIEPGNVEPLFLQPLTKAPKIIVLATELTKIDALNSKRSDPTIRGFDQEKANPKRVEKNTNNDWGPLLSKQDNNFKFCRFEICTRQSFGHRTGDGTPHEFEARNLLFKLATDPGIVAIMKDRQLLVGILGEMDPIDDRLMQQTQEQHGGHLLGYNTNGGARIDLKLRTDDLKAFLPYPQIVSTLIHELSHNWVGDHNLLFWTNYGQMMIDYCATHAFGTAGTYVSSQSTGQIAGLPISIRANMDNVLQYVMSDLGRNMMQHGLAAASIESLVRQRCDELIEQRGYGKGLVLGGNSAMSSNPTNAREMALQAAERRLRDQKEKADDGNSEVDSRRKER